MKKNIHSNTVALGLGFFLIVLIAIVAFFRTNNITKISNNEMTSTTTAITENIRKATKISSSDLAKKMLDPKNELTILDLRSAENFSKEHLLNSHSVPALTVTAATAGLDKNNLYVLIDEGSSVELTAMVIKAMTEAGFTNIAYLDGGFAAWKSGFNPIISVGDPTSFVDQSKVSYFESDQLQAMLQAKDRLALIDVRKKEEFDAGHLPGAINIFLDDIEKNKSSIPSNKRIVLYDNDSFSAFQAAVRLFDMGFFNTLTLADGLNGWKAKNYAIVK